VQAERDLLERSARRIQDVAGAASPLAQLAVAIERLVRGELQEELDRTAQQQKEFESVIRQVPDSLRQAVNRFLTVSREARETTSRRQREIEQLTAEIDRYHLEMTTADGLPTALSLGEIVRAYPANQLSLTEKMGVYLDRWHEFLVEDPREANSEGGVFPAIWGTVAMTLIMSLVVVPFGVLAALYLREYARAGLWISVIRVAINNLAGVPSIVFGVFGLSFFCYRVGAFLDGGPRNAGIAPWPAPIWFLGLGVLASLALAAFAAALYQLARPRSGRASASGWAGYGTGVLWITAAAGFVTLFATSPFFHGFYEAQLPNPVFGKGGLLWASLTLALLTLPVVIVATEEALSAVPNSLREGSYACGAGKWQTIRRIVLPHALPGIMTGMILAMARGAGEVAPLMLVGAVKLAPELPVTLADWTGRLGPLPSGPFHFDRSFMHLGFHVYDLGFQSQNSDAAKPLVFTTTLLLILIVATLNVAAIALRARLRRRFHSGQF
jgi:ABC-type phosphate transport system permease subunit